ncbi:MAG: EpsG family protein [Oscillibacter sp.]|nr:EpsG family protein [Oscillibacter sp.]
MKTNENYAFKDKVNAILLFLLFIFFPGMAFPMILIKVFENKRYAYIILAAWLSLFAVLYPPVTDYYRHISDYFSYSDYSFSQFLSLGKLDITLPFLSYFAAKNGIHFEIIRFIFTFISLSCYFYIFYNESIKSIVLNDKKYRFFSFLILFFLSNYFSIIIGLRFQLGQALFVLGVYQYLISNKKIAGIIILIFSALTHFLFIPLLVLTLLLNILKRFKIPRKLIVLGFLLMPLLTNIIVKYSLEVAGVGELGNRIEGYTTGSWGILLMDTLSFKGKVFMIIGVAPFIPLLIYFWKKVFNSSYSNLISILLISLGLFLNFIIIEERLISVLKMLLFVFFICNLCKQKLDFRILRSTFVVSSILFFSVIYSQRIYFTGNRLYKFAYCPSWIILSNQYTEKWINNNIDAEGFINDIIKE